MEKETDIKKKKLRKQIAAARMALEPTDREERCQSIFRKVTEHPAFLRADLIYSFVDAKGEVDTHQIIREAWRQGKWVAVPRIEKHEMHFYYITEFNQLEPGGFGISEPTADCQPAAGIDSALMIMPGMVFDREGHRIGYGGGYYDRYLAEHRGLPTIAVAFDLQVLEQIPSEAHDIKPNILITENGVIKF